MLAPYYVLRRGQTRHGPELTGPDRLARPAKLRDQRETGL